MQGEKSLEYRFTIQFSKDNPDHVALAEALNEQGYKGKANYLVGIYSELLELREKTKNLDTREQENNLVDKLVDIVAKLESSKGIRSDNEFVAANHGLSKKPDHIQSLADNMAAFK